MRTMTRFGWAMAFLGVLVAPLLLSVGAGTRSGIDMEVSLVLGLVGASALAATIVVVSRIRSLTTGLGIEQILLVHRYLAMLVVGLVLAHLALVVLADPHNIALLDLGHAPPRARAATVATIALIGLTSTAVLRKRLRLPYRAWRILHLALALAAVVGTALHVWWLQHLIRDDGMRGAFAALAGVLGVVFVVRWFARPLRAGRTAYRVLHVRAESDAVSTLMLAPARRMHPSRRARMEFAPGQFAWLRLRRWALFTDHPFSIASGSRPNGTVEFTVRQVGDYTQMLGKVRAGTRVYLDGPHGAFSVDHTRATGLVLLAGGVGITPMMSMLRTLADRGDRRPHRILLGGRTEADLLFLDELDDLRARLNLTVVPTLTKPSDGWTGSTGRIGAALLSDVLPGPFRRNQLDYFLCGSAPFVTGVVQALRELGVPPQRIHTEQFDMV